MWLLLINICLCSSLKIDFIPQPRTPPPFRQHSFMDYLKSRKSIIVFGGDCSDCLYADVWEFSLDTLFWVKIIVTSIEVPPARTYLGGFTSWTEPKFYIFAGHTDLGRKNDLWEFDFIIFGWQKIKTSSTPLPISTYAYTSYIADEVQYFVIQSGAYSNAITNDMFRYKIFRLNCSSFEWEKLPSSGEAPYPTYGSILQYYDGNILQTAGELWKDGFHYLYSYSLENLTWSIISNSTVPSECLYAPASFIYNDELYLICKWRYEIDKNFYQSIKLNLFEGKKEWKNLNLFPFFYEIVSFSSVKIENLLYIFGCYTNASDTIFSNTFGKITLSDFEHQLINNHFVQPPPRSYHSMTIISGKILIFGGVDSVKIFNDIWTFDLMTEVWEPLLPKGTIPTPRYHHSAGSDGDIFVIWGGMSSSGLVNDLFIFNSITEFWTELIPKTTDNPSPARGACLVVKNFMVFLYGGERIDGKSNELWKYDIGTNEFRLLSADGLQSVSSPYCWLDSDLFYVSLGCKKTGLGSDEIDFFNLSSMSWHIYHDPDFQNWSNYQICHSSQVVIGNYIITIGGEYSSLFPWYDITAFGPGEEKIDLNYITFVSFSTGFVYFNKSLYVHGGGRGRKDFVSPLLGNPIFAKFDVEDLCKTIGCDALCSTGTYVFENTCKPCAKGTYSDRQGSLKCQECPPGTYSDKIAATSKIQCIPCPQGTFNNETAAEVCKNCSENSTCPVGSISPLKLQKIPEISSSQPSIYKEPDLSNDLLLFRLLVIIPSCVVVACCLIIQKLRNYLEKLDLYDLQHDDETSDYLIKKQTKIGGLFTVFFIIGSLMLTCSAILTYTKANIEETKGQVPLIVIESDVSSFTSDQLTFEIFLSSFGGECVQNSQCSPSINPYLVKIECSHQKLSCISHINKTCIISIVCSDGEFKTGAEVNFNITENLSYTSGMLISITASSSIPNEDSSVSSIVLPKNGSVFIGSVASEFYFLVTPSLFQSDSSKWEKEATGYHISERNSPIYGSQHITEDLSFVSNLYLKMLIEINSSVLITKRLLKQDLFFFVGALLGAVSGLFGLTGFFMSLFEQYFEKLMKRLKNKKVDPQPKYSINISESPFEKSEDVPEVICSKSEASDTSRVKNEKV